MHVKFIIIILFLMTGLTGYAQPINVIAKHGNIWLIDTSGREIQLTTTGKDSMPVLSWNRKYVACIRKTTGSKYMSNDFDSSQIWLFKLDSNKSELLIQSKADSMNAMSVLRGGFDALQFSLDSRYLYFLSEAWTMSMAVHRVDIETKKDQFLSDGNSLYIIPNGADAGDLIVLKHKYHNYNGTGSYDDNWLLAPDGTEIKDIGLYKLEVK